MSPSHHSPHVQSPCHLPPPVPARSWCHPTLAHLIVPVRGEWSRIWPRHPEADGILIAADTVTTAAASNPVPYHCAPPSRPACPACPACPAPCVPRMPGVSRVPCLPCVLCASLPCLPRVPCLPPYGRRSQIAHRQQVSKGRGRPSYHRQHLLPRLPCPRREMSYAVRRLRLCLVDLRRRRRSWQEYQPWVCLDYNPGWITTLGLLQQLSRSPSSPCSARPKPRQQPVDCAQGSTAPRPAAPRRAQPRHAA